MECIKNKQKIQALGLLKEKKMVQQFIEKKMSSYNTLQNILLKIQSCESDNDVSVIYILNLIMIFYFI